MTLFVKAPFVVHARAGVGFLGTGFDRRRRSLRNPELGGSIRSGRRATNTRYRSCLRVAKIRNAAKSEAAHEMK